MALFPAERGCSLSCEATLDFARRSPAALANLAAAEVERRVIAAFQSRALRLAKGGSRSTDRISADLVNPADPRKRAPGILATRTWMPAFRLRRSRSGPDRLGEMGHLRCTLRLLVAALAGGADTDCMKPLRRCRRLLSRRRRSGARRSIARDCAWPARRRRRSKPVRRFFHAFFGAAAAGPIRCRRRVLDPCLGLASIACWPGVFGLTAADRLTRRSARSVRAGVFRNCRGQRNLIACCRRILDRRRSSPESPWVCSPRVCCCGRRSRPRGGRARDDERSPSQSAAKSTCSVYAMLDASPVVLALSACVAAAGRPRLDRVHRRAIGAGRWQCASSVSRPGRVQRHSGAYRADADGSTLFRFVLGPLCEEAPRRVRRRGRCRWIAAALVVFRALATIDRIQAPPAIVFQDEKGVNVDLSAFAATWCARSFWATWCQPCRNVQSPSFDRLQARLGLREASKSSRFPSTLGARRGRRLLSRPKSSICRNVDDTRRARSPGPDGHPGHLSLDRQGREASVSRGRSIGRPRCWTAGWISRNE